MTGCKSAVLGLCVLLAAGGGCVNNQKEIARYRAILDAGANGPVAPLGPGEELSLSRALLLANQDNERLMIEGENYIQALSEKDRAFSGFLPTITIPVAYTISHNQNAGASATGSDGIARPVGTSGGFRAVGRTLRRWEVPVQGSGNLFRGFRDVASLEAADWTIEQRKQLLLDAQATLLLEVVQAYYSVVRAERSAEVIRRTLDAETERVRDARARLNAGTGRPLDVAQAEAQQASTRVTLTQAESDSRNARTLLAFLIGAREVSGALRDDYAVPLEIGSVDDLLEAAWASREDYKAAKALVEAESHNVDAAIAQYYPSVTFNATGFLYRENFSDASKWNTLLQISIPIFQAGVIEADVRAAWSRLRQAALAESLLRRQIEEEVRTRYESLMTSTLQLKELQAQIRAAAEAYRQSRAAFNAGTAIFLDVLTAQNVLLNSELALTTEEFNEKVLYLDLMRSVARLNPAAVVRAAAATRPTSGPATGPATLPTPAEAPTR